MPTSVEENKDWIAQQIQGMQNIRTVLDVGPGAGRYGDILRMTVPWAYTTAVEIWPRYVEQFDLNSKYDEVVVGDVRKVDNFEYDLVIFGDVIEHMSKEDALVLWKKVSKQARYAVISLPIIHWEQGEYEGNPYEAHVAHWNHIEVIENFPHIKKSVLGNATGAYVAEF